MSKSLDAKIIEAELNRNPKMVEVLGKHQTSTRVRISEPPQVADNVVKIINDCDPLQFLMDVMNGCAIQHHVVDADGTIHTFFDTPSMPQRISVAKYLADKYVPKVTLSQHRHLVENYTKPEDRPEHGGSEKGSFDKMIDHAASKAQKPQN